MNIKLIIPGNPIAKKRPRFVRRGKFVGAYNCQETEEGRFAMEARFQLSGVESIPMESAIYLTCNFYMPIPKSWTKKKLRELEQSGISHVSKPDLDNLCKFVKDALNGVAWKDDNQIIVLWAEKEYSHNPRTELNIKYYDGE